MTGIYFRRDRDERITLRQQARCKMPDDFQPVSPGANCAIADRWLVMRNRGSEMTGRKSGVVSRGGGPPAWFPVIFSASVIRASLAGSARPLCSKLPNSRLQGKWESPESHKPQATAFALDSKCNDCCTHRARCLRFESRAWTL